MNNKEQVLQWLNSSEAKAAKLEQEAKVRVQVMMMFMRNTAGHAEEDLEYEKECSGM